MIRFAVEQDINAWLELAKEVESLFGEMVGNEDFKEGINEIRKITGLVPALNLFIINLFL